jgi:hypothetical protein
MQKLLLFCGAFGLAIAIAGCSGSNTNTPAAQAAAVTVHISDPATCSATHGGSFASVFVTISDVLIHTNPAAGPNDGGWVDLTPNLKNHPMQVNLLSQADTSCFLATLGDSTQIQPGTYQQIRLLIANKSQASSIVGAGVNGTNACAAVQDVNCVVPTTGSPLALFIPSGLQTGIKIPSGQIAGGQFTVPAGQSVDLDIDVLTCESVVLAGNQAIFKPVLHAGEVSQQKATINGTVVDNGTGAPIAGAVVMLAQHGAGCAGAGCVSNAAIEDVVMEQATDQSGNFVFCPILGTGPFDVIAMAVNNGTTSAVTVVASVPVGSTLTGANKVKLINAGAQATINGTVTTTSASSTAIAEQGINVAALQPFTVNSTNLLLRIPTVSPFSTVTTISTVVPTPNTCSSNTVGCGDYSLLVPGENANVGVFNVAGTSFAQASGNANYIVDAQTSSCTPSEEQTNTLTPSGGVTVGNTFTASTLAFTGCQ